MVTRRTGPRPQPLPLLLVLLTCLLGLQWAAPAAAQTSSAAAQNATSAAASEPSPPSADLPSPQSADLPSPQSADLVTGPVGDPVEMYEDPEPGGLTTGEREALCLADIAQQSPGDTEDSARTRRSSEWSPEHQLAASGDDTGPPAMVSGGCPTTWDSALCWPATGAGRNRSLPCFHEFKGILYNTNDQASRVCQPDGVWASSADYTACRSLLLSYPCTPQQHSGSAPIDAILKMHTVSASIEAATAIYLTGYSASLVALVAATAIFRHFKELRCPRNIIHTNLFVASMVADALWITVLTIELAMADTTPTSCGLFILLHYFHVATFFWMFVEGLHLYMMVVQTFTVDRVKLYLYPLIGWGPPLVVVTAWCIVKASAADDAPEEPVGLSVHQLCAVAGGNHSFVRGLEPPMEHSFFSQCPWLEDSDWDWVHTGPSLLVLACNVVFLAKIMCVLITKLRSTNSTETQQYKKATKALLVLMPLLGVTYILVLVSPSTTSVIYYIQAVLMSTQGLVVSLLYCFCNGEVQLTLRKHWRRRRGKTYLSPGDANCCRLEPGSSRLNTARDSSTTDLTYTTATEIDAV